MRLSIILFLIFISVADCFCQNRNSVWCFGDSALIDFSDTTNIIVGSCGLDSRGSCVSISNENGKLLFSAATRANTAGITGRVFDSTQQIMLNGDTIIGDGWYNEMVIIPNPLNDSTYYLFSIGVTQTYGLWYSMIDMKLNNGLGAVSNKNIQLQNFPTVDCLHAVKHGNGRDWWIIFRRDPNFSPSNEFLTYLITPNGITNYTQQNVGGPIYSNNADFAFSTSGNKMAVMSYNGLIEILEFDRCSGLLILEHHIQTGVLVPPSPHLWSVAFSQDESKLYITTNDTLSFLFQYDLNASNIAASKDTLWSTSYPIHACGALKLAPDNKIYLSNVYYTPTVLFYPYADSMYNMYNMNLSVINSPDSLGAACDFQPYSFYLGGKRTYLGLPNNPDYEMPRDSGSVCDTIQWTGVQNIEQTKGIMYVTYISAWQKLFVNAQGLKGRDFKMYVHDLLGKVIYKEEGKLSGQYFTKDLNMAAFAKGMYIVTLTTNREQVTQKFIKE